MLLNLKKVEFEVEKGHICCLKKDTIKVFKRIISNRSSDVVDTKKSDTNIVGYQRVGSDSSKFQMVGLDTQTVEHFLQIPCNFL